MPHKYFTSHTNGTNAYLQADEAKHFATVMRGKIGQELSLCDGKGTDYIGKVTQITPQEITLEIISCKQSECEASVQVTLYVGYPKQDKLEMIIQKATELGAVKIVPFFSRNCVATPKKEEQKNIRYSRIALEATKQSGRSVIPTIEMPITYKEMLKQCAENDVTLFCYECGGEPLHIQLNNVKSIGIITGCEGGFTELEAEMAKESNCKTIGLGARILRCETAPIAALCAVMTLTGNLQ